MNLRKKLFSLAAASFVSGCASQTIGPSETTPTLGHPNWTGDIVQNAMESNFQHYLINRYVEAVRDYGRDLIAGTLKPGEQQECLAGRKALENFSKTPRSGSTLEEIVISELAETVTHEIDTEDAYPCPSEADYKLRGYKAFNEPSSTSRFLIPETTPPAFRPVAPSEPEPVPSKPRLSSHSFKGLLNTTEATLCRGRRDGATRARHSEKSIAFWARSLKSCNPL